MKTFILILILSTGSQNGGVSMLQLRYQNRQHCEAAGRMFLEQTQENYPVNSSYACLPLSAVEGVK